MTRTLVTVLCTVNPRTEIFSVECLMSKSTAAWTCGARLGLMNKLFYRTVWIHQKSKPLKSDFIIGNGGALSEAVISKSDGEVHRFRHEIPGKTHLSVCCLETPQTDWNRWTPCQYNTAWVSGSALCVATSIDSQEFKWVWLIDFVLRNCHFEFPCSIVNV